MPVICSTKALHIVYVDRFPPIGLHILCQSGSLGRRGLGKEEPERRHMGLLEYRTMPSLRDVTHEGMVVYIYYVTAARNSVRSQLGSSCQGNRYGTEKAGALARTKSHLPGHSPPASMAAALLGQPSSLFLASLYGESTVKNRQLL